MIVVFPWSSRLVFRFCGGAWNLHFVSKGHKNRIRETANNPQSSLLSLPSESVVTQPLANVAAKGG
jgi:hypothetical protein